MASAHGNLAHLLPPNFKRIVASWLEEDCPSFDYGGFVVGEKMAQARLWGKSGVRREFSICYSFVKRGVRLSLNKYDVTSSILSPVLT